MNQTPCYIQSLRHCLDELRAGLFSVKETDQELFAEGNDNTGTAAIQGAAAMNLFRTQNPGSAHCAEWTVCWRVAVQGRSGVGEQLSGITGLQLRVSVQRMACAQVRLSALVGIQRPK